MRDLVTPGGAAGIWVPNRPECVVKLSWQKEKAWAGVSSLQLLSDWPVTAFLHCSFFLMVKEGYENVRLDNPFQYESSPQPFILLYILAASYQAGL